MRRIMPRRYGTREKSFESDLDAAARVSSAAVRRIPSPSTHISFSRKIYTRKSEPGAALREYQEAIRIDPKSADAQFNLGFVYFSRKRYEEARQQYEKVDRSQAAVPRRCLLQPLGLLRADEEKARGDGDATARPRGCSDQQSTAPTPEAARRLSR